MNGNIEVSPVEESQQVDNKHYANWLEILMNEEIFPGLLQVTYQKATNTDSILSTTTVEYVVDNVNPKLIRVKTSGIIFTYGYSHIFIIKDLSSGKDSQYEVIVRYEPVEIHIHKHLYQFNEDDEPPTVTITATGITNLYAKDVRRGILNELTGTSGTYTFVPENYAQKVEISVKSYTSIRN